jgi:hypothetical protein
VREREHGDAPVSIVRRAIGRLAAHRLGTRPGRCRTCVSAGARAPRPDPARRRFAREGTRRARSGARAEPRWHPAPPATRHTRRRAGQAAVSLRSRRTPQTLSTGGPERTNETVRSLHARAVCTELGSSAEKRGFPRRLLPARGLLLLRLRLRARVLARPCRLPLLLLGGHLPSWTPCPLLLDSMLAGSTNSLRGSSRLARGWRAVDWAER